MPDHISEDRKWEPNNETITNLHQAGYSLKHATKYVTFAHFFNKYPIASGALEFLERHQQKLNEFKLKTEIIFLDSGMKIK